MRIALRTSLHLMPGSLIVIRLDEGVLNLLASVDWGDQDQEGTPCNEQTQRTGAGVAFVVCSISSQLQISHNT